MSSLRYFVYTLCKAFLYEIRETNKMSIIHYTVHKIPGVIYIFLHFVRMPNTNTEHEQSIFVA